MTVRMVILGLLRDRPLYGYEIKQIIEEHMSDWTSIAFGSIYFALDKLAEEGFVEKIGVEQPGKRPSRSVYQISESGRQEFLRLLRESWLAVEQEFYAIDICLFFLESLPREEVVNYLQARKQKLDQVLDHIEKHREEQLANPQVPAMARAIFNHSLAHSRAEAAWLEEVLAGMKSGHY